MDRTTVLPARLLATRQQLAQTSYYGGWYMWGQLKASLLPLLKRVKTRSCSRRSIKVLWHSCERLFDTIIRGGAGGGVDAACRVTTEGE